MFELRFLGIAIMGTIVKNQKKFTQLLWVSVLLMACSSAVNLESMVSPTATLTPTFMLTPAPPPPTHTLTPMPTPTPTVILTLTPSPTPASNEVYDIPIMPEAILDNGTPFPQANSEGLIAYEALTTLEAVRDFYRNTLTAQDWEWVYTETGESFALGRPGPILLQEFRQNETQLAIIAANNEVTDTPSPGVVILIARDASAAEFMFELTGGFLMQAYLGYDLAEMTTTDAMQFTSPRLQFNHSANWVPTQNQPFAFQTDLEEGAINIYSDPTPCASPQMECFISFTILSGNILKAPISIGIHPHQSEMALDAFDAQRWNTLVDISNLPPSDFRDVRQFEDLVAPGSLEPIETKPITLRDGTPALQRIYRWRQIGLSTPLVSSYTLFKHDDEIVEFRTDFTEEEWAILGPAVQETILSVELTP